MQLPTNHIAALALEHLRYASAATLVTSTVLLSGFFIVEPAVSRAGTVADTATFRVRQTITDESSFLVNPANVVMDQSINGVTGGSATGTTYFVVQSNNTAGYTVEIDFFDNGTPNAMIGDVSDGEGIRDYNEYAGLSPTFNFNASSAAQFGYTVNSSSTNETAPAFRYDASNVCDNGGLSEAYGRCWMTPSTTGYTIVDKTGPSTNGATTTIAFRVVVPSNPIPTVEAETYTATATLSLITK